MIRPVHGGNLAWAAALAGCPPSAILDFSASISPLGPPESALAAIQAHLSSLTAYPDPDYGELRTALGEALNVDPDWILPGNGSAELLTWAAWDLSKLEATYLVTPAFGDYWRALSAFGAQVLDCPLDLTSCTIVKNGQDAHSTRDEFSCGTGILPVPKQVIENGGTSGLDLKSLDAGTGNGLVSDDLSVSNGSLVSPSFPLPVPLALGADRALLLNNPHNPTGLLFGREAIRPYLEQLGMVVVDEAFMDFLPPAEQQSSIALVEEFPNLVILRSLTKFYSLPGLRMGCAIAHPDILRRWQLLRDPWPVNALAAAAAAAMVRDAAFERQTWDWLPGARRELFEGLADLPGLRPMAGAANFLLVESSVSVAAIQKSLLQQHRILIRDCLSFPELGDRFFRVAVRDRADNLRLIAGLADVIRNGNLIT
ncbi:MAG: pyridoxal phosphate-dependent aminotransferase [Microcoleus sp. PH2017_29_MFU_D_A]|uniref:pyridoxal phosphate-dependent aminotransferase n=1 Tax=unclassified Microcoleus TaxID=2642155 RepID=UPI001D5A03F1|nr:MULTISPECIES: threonine-phosphate decarboxylase [unclassified Microcoleus]MCC3417454.1 pyridoxal phosphate-dependent aminotransferase [Microcoleus sp. PH2017_07_MST_O_A]MCC3430137.1 pyridoxal phosphate-dependent aminotransferase [Microcoleus sp. PH2017_04_SCI_O_A]TAF92169.1 MAG: pyridoxal phosphate-dependent aminotransferase [Oscillatoriales cyanobacterium]MCC3449173.1 pyridoxal phosphate-dependent aminotransferase [Microcoleus sp. PH2017_09_SFU_O_A]MCC3604243.1 pyridoxal phosphate-dependen